MQKLYQVKLTEDEMKAVIDHHATAMCIGEITVERSKRIHDLTKRLSNDGPEIETEKAIPEMPEGEIKPSTADTNINVNTGWPS